MVVTVCVSVGLVSLVLCHKTTERERWKEWRGCDGLLVWCQHDLRTKTSTDPDTTKRNQKQRSHMKSSMTHSRTVTNSSCVLRLWGRRHVPLPASILRPQRRWP